MKDVVWTGNWQLKMDVLFLRAWSGFWTSLLTSKRDFVFSSDLDFFFSFSVLVCAISQYIRCNLVTCWQQQVGYQFTLSGLWKIQNYGLLLIFVERVWMTPTLYTGRSTFLYNLCYCVLPTFTSRGPQNQSIIVNFCMGLNENNISFTSNQASWLNFWFIK